MCEEFKSIRRKFSFRQGESYSNFLMDSEYSPVWIKVWGSVGVTTSILNPIIATVNPPFSNWYRG